MAKTINPAKIFISINGEGEAVDVLVQYKVATDGIVSNRFSSLKVNAAVDMEKVSEIVDAALAAANTAEGIE